MVIVDPRQRDTGIPTDAYFAVEEIKDVSRFGAYWTQERSRTLAEKLGIEQREGQSD